ncbi:hypothetical protein DRN74_01625 [Candidatus Micrarchaeota archaeon]|nr:MAG: hypothetical protein DRN74_01625 [Candidatus Micrarchaeota archaeon]
MSDLVSKLKTLGFTDYEAKAYIALVSSGAASVTEISQICDVPRSNLYSVLEKLNEKGFVEIQRGRPIMFQAVKPSKALNEQVDKLTKSIEKAKKEAIKELEAMIKSTQKNIEPALIWAVKGSSAVTTRLAEMIKRSRKEVLINTPSLSLLNENVVKAIKEASERGVKIKVVTQSTRGIELFRKICIVRSRDKIYGLDAVVDEREVLVAPAMPAIAVWVDNPTMAAHVKDFLNLVWKDSNIIGK